MGWTTVAIGSSQVLFLYGQGGDFKKRKIELILGTLLAASYIALGVAGGLNALRITQVGAGILGTFGVRAF